MRRISFVLTVLLLALFGRANAQLPDDDYYPYDAVREERVPVLVPDTTLFYGAVQAVEDLYAAATDFNLPAVAVARRGFRDECVFFEGMPLSWRYGAALRLMGAQESRLPGAAFTGREVGATGGMRSFRLTEPIDGERAFAASVNVSGRNHLLGAKIAASGDLGRGWSGAVAADARTGRDLWVEGVFTNALTLGLRAEKRFAAGRSLALLLVVPPSMRGLRSASVAEAFALTGDNLYNPAWGFQGGKVRNARVRREAVPLTAAVWRMPLDRRVHLEASFAAQAGVRRQSGLGWYNARTPLPDNYRCLPSYTGDRATEEAWRQRDPRYTQVDWDGMIAVNRLAGGEAVFALEDRVERIGDMQVRAGCTFEADERLTLAGGVRVGLSNNRFFKQMRDLLGAEHLTDIDQYLVDDDTYGNLLQNDVRHPDRTIRRGDRFGYDYELQRREIEVRAHAAYRSDRFRFEAALSLGDAVVRRRGRYEKELFPGNLSFGRSRALRFTPYAFKALAIWAFTPRHAIEATLAAGAVVPEAADLFYQPSYNNRTVDDPECERFYAAEVDYRHTGPAVRFRLTGFVSLTRDGCRTLRYFDDLAAVYSDLAVAGLSRLAVGAEAAADIRLSYRWSLSLAASAGRYTHAADPRLTILSDVDNTPVDVRAASYLKGLSVGGAPRLTACAGVRYFGPRGWGVRASAGYAAGRYAEPSPLRRTERVARQAGTTPELFDAIVRQQRLRDAFTLEVSLFKTFYFTRSRLTAALMLHNLTGAADTVYDAYESLRLMRVRSGDATFRMPQPARLTHAYPRTFYLTISYKY